LKKTILIVAAICLAAILCGASAQVAASEMTVLKGDSGKNLSEMKLMLYSAVNDFGDNGVNVGEAVKFTAPKAGWKLKEISILGWSGYNETTKRLPQNMNFLVEVRDKNLNLLYKFADTQNAYFASTQGPVASRIEIPAMQIMGDFYVVFYDRGAMGIAMEQGNGTGNSYLLINDQLIPAERKSETNETIKDNWLIRVAGE
jgi:hypothetical protein